MHFRCNRIFSYHVIRCYGGDDDDDDDEFASFCFSYYLVSPISNLLVFGCNRQCNYLQSLEL